MSGVRLAGLTLALLFFAFANGAGTLSLGPPQALVFRRVMYLMGLGSVAGLTFGEQISRWAVKTIKRLDLWILQGSHRALFLLVAIILAYTTVWCAVSSLRHYYFHSSLDLGVFNQVVWNTAHGHLFSRSLEVTNHFADHVQPYLPLLSLLYLVVPSPYVLLAFQSLVLGLSAWPLYSLARRKFDSPAIGLAFAFCILAYPPLGFLNRFDFHAEVIAVPLLIAAYERIDANDLKVAGLFLGLALLGKENIGLSVATFGFVVALYHKHWGFGLTWTGVGLAYFLVTLFVIIPVFREAPAGAFARYHWLGDAPPRMLWTLISRPFFVLEKLTVTRHFLTLWELLAPFAFVPLLGFPLLIPAIPTLVYNFMSDWPSQTTVYYQYMAPVIPFVGIAGVLGLQRLAANPRTAKLFCLISPGQMRSERVVGLAVVIMLLAAATSWTYDNPVTGNTILSSAPVTRFVQAGKQPAIIQSNDAAIREGLKHVPDAVHLLTTGNYLPHLSQRTQIHSIQRAPVSDLGPGVDAIFLNLKDLRRRSCEDYFQNLRLAQSAGFGATFYRDSVLLLQKGKGDFKALENLIADWPGCT